MFESLKFSFSETNWIVGTVLGIYIWFVNKQSASSKEVLDLRVRVVELENTVKDMPSKLEIARLEGQVETIKTQLNAAIKQLVDVSVVARLGRIVDC